MRFAEYIKVEKKDTWIYRNYSSKTPFPTFLNLKIWGVYYTQKLNINLLSSYVHHYIQDSMTEYKLYLRSRLISM